MKMIYMKTLIVVLALMISGCALQSNLHQVNLGSDKESVIQTLGRPVNAYGDGNNEYLWFKAISDFWNSHYVQLTDGRVTAYGTMGPLQRKDKTPN